MAAYILDSHQAVKIEIVVTVEAYMNVLANCIPGEYQSDDCKLAKQELEANDGYYWDEKTSVNK